MLGITKDHTGAEDLYKSEDIVLKNKVQNAESTETRNPGEQPLETK